MDNRSRLKYFFDAIQGVAPFLDISKLGDDPKSILIKNSINDITTIIISILENESTLDDAIDGDGNTYMHFAANANNKEIVSYLLEKRKVNINIQNHSGESALHILCRKNKDHSYNQMIELLLTNSEINIQLKDKHGKTALANGISNCDKKVIHLILKYKELDEISFFQVCNETLRGGFPFLVRTLLRHQHTHHPSLTTMRKSLSKLASSAARRGHIPIIEQVYKINKKAIKHSSEAYKLIRHPNRELINNFCSSMNLIKSEYKTYAPDQTPILKYHHAKLILAAKQEKYHVTKTITIFPDDKQPGSDSKEFNQFLMNLKKMLVDSKNTLSFDNVNLRTQFIITGSHWIAGDIQISKGKMRVLFIDSLGSWEGGSWKRLLISDYIKIVHTFFPAADIFCNVEKLQRSDYTSCTLFAIDSVLHLQNADEFIIKSASRTDLYDYLLEHQIAKKQLDLKSPTSGLIYYTHLPLRLIRCMQSLYTKPLSDTPNLLHKVGLFSRIDIASKEEAGAVVNKRGETALDSVKHHLGTMDDKKINLRIQYKLGRMRKAVIHYMLSHSNSEIESAIKPLDVESVLSKIKSTYSAGSIELSKPRV